MRLELFMATFRWICIQFATASSYTLRTKRAHADEKAFCIRIFERYSIEFDLNLNLAVNRTAYERCKFALEIPIYSLLIPIHRIRFSSLRSNSTRSTERIKPYFFQLIFIETVRRKASECRAIREWNDSDICMKLWMNVCSWLKLINKNF